MSTQISIEALKEYMDKMNYDTPAEAIADILHFCDLQNIDFQEVLALGVSYHREDLEEGVMHSPIQP